VVDRIEFNYCWKLLTMLRLGMNQVSEIVMNSPHERLITILEMDAMARQKELWR